MSFFGGSNPFATPVGQMIERATEGAHASEDWGKYMEICDAVNELEDGPKDAVKALKKRITTNTGKNYTVVMYSLTILETLVKNCGKRFHSHVASKDFMQEMVKIIGPKNDPPQIVQEKVLSLIQTWADAFQGNQELKEVCKVYQDLKHKGIEFPMTDLDAMAPIHTPARSAPGEDPVARPPQRAPTTRAAPVGHAGSPQPHAAMPAVAVAGAGGMMPPPPPQGQPQGYPQGQPPPQQQPPLQPPTGPVLLSPEQMGKLRSELDTVQQNSKVFSEMLTEMTGGQEDTADMDLLLELNRTCRQMQQRLVELVERVQNEEVTGELLRINDELNNVFLRYDRYERLRGGPQANQAPAASQPPVLPPMGMPAAAPTAAQLPPPYQPSPAGGGEPIPDLIDLETPSPQIQPPAPPAYAPTLTTGGGPASGEDISAQLAGMNLGANSVSSTLGQLNTTTATNNPTSGAAEDEFDMFAQSRQTFDQNRQAPAGSSYANQGQQDQYMGGLGAAVTAKSSGAPQQQETMQNLRNKKLTDKEGDYNEMEKWLVENTGPAAGAPGPGTGTESATSLEFDQFLAARAMDSDTLPDSDPSQRSTNSRGGRQMQKDDQDSALFAL